MKLKWILMNMPTRRGIEEHNKHKWTESTLGDTGSCPAADIRASARDVATPNNVDHG